MLTSALEMLSEILIDKGCRLQSIDDVCLLMECEHSVIRAIKEPTCKGHDFIHIELCPKKIFYSWSVSCWIETVIPDASDVFLDSISSDVKVNLLNRLTDALHMSKIYSDLLNIDTSMRVIMRVEDRE